MEYLITMESERYGHETCWYDTREEQSIGLLRLLETAVRYAEKTDKVQRRITVWVLPMNREYFEEV